MRPRVTSVGLIVLPDPAEHFEYPAHIDRASLDALPAQPGVYFFRDRNGAPLYIGKSVNIRARVLSHLRSPNEAAMLRSSRSVDCVRTAGEIGALLLESHLIKQMQPAHNVLLRSQGETFALALAPGETRPQVVDSAQAAAHCASSLFGLFASSRAALEGLRALVRQHGLCPALTGLETISCGRGCFSRQIGRCRGACTGNESAQAHQARLRAALRQLQASVWPYDGPVGIIEEGDGLRQIHVVERWSYLGSLQGRRRKLRRPAAQEIDIDTWKILARPMQSGALDLRPCRVSRDAVYYDA